MPAKVHGVERFKQRLRERSKVYEDATIGAAQQTAQYLLERTKQVVPVKTGALRDSGHVVDSGDGAAVRFDAPHALFVHEDLSKHHQTGQAKFLTTTAIVERAAMRRIAVDEARQRL
jgi:hypothetical protein